jgi:hypothetical protein
VALKNAPHLNTTHTPPPYTHTMHPAFRKMFSVNSRRRKRSASCPPRAMGDSHSEPLPPPPPIASAKDKETRTLNYLTQFLGYRCVGVCGCVGVWVCGNGETCGVCAGSQNALEGGSLASCLAAPIPCTARLL